MSRILLVEDDPVLGKGLKFALEKEGFEVHWVTSKAEAEMLANDRIFELVALDLNLPDGSGLTFAKWAAKNRPRLPILMITASGDEDTVVAGFEAGAVDYVRKPFGNKEFLARIKVVLKGKSQQKFKAFHYGEITVQPEQRLVKVGESPVELNRRQFQILCHFMANAESVVTREGLIEALGKNEEILDRTIDSHISHLRNKLRKAGVVQVQISPVYGLGYRLEKKV
jgi:two-component system OmpR family response regulator